MIHTIQLAGYAIDIFALLRIILGLWGFYYYQLFSRRLDAVFYQWRIRQLMSVFFVLEAFADLAIDALGGPPAFLLLRSVGRLGIAYTIFAASQKTLKTAAMGAALMTSPLAGVVRVAGMDLDLFSLASMALVLAAIWNFSIYSEILKPSRLQDSARRFFLLSVLASYVFQSVAVLYGMNLDTLVELMETIAVAIGFVMVRAVLKSDETRMATR